MDGRVADTVRVQRHVDVAGQSRAVRLLVADPHSSEELAVPRAVALRDREVVLAVPGHLLCIVDDLVGVSGGVDVDCVESQRSETVSSAGLQTLETHGKPPPCGRR